MPFFLLLFLCCTGTWLCLHNLLAFEGWYGPAGIKSLSALFQGKTDWDTYTNLLSHVQRLLPFDPITDAFLLSFVGYLMTSIGMGLLGKKWFSIHYAIIPSIIFYAPLLMLSQLLGPDILCLGLIFLGLGVAQTFVPISLLMWLYSAALKPIALPALAIIPLSIPKRTFFILFIPTLTFLLYQHQLPQLQHLPTYIPTLIEKTPPSLAALFSLCLLFTCIHKKNRKRNLILLGLIVFSCSFVALKFSTKLRPRYLIASTLPLIVLGTGLLCSKKNIVYRILLVSFWAFLALDSWNFLHTWDQLFIKKEGKSQSGIPKPPSMFNSIYGTTTDLIHSDHSAQGAQSLQKIAPSLTYGGAIVELRDTRHHHLIAPLAQHQLPFRIISPEHCCRPQEDRKQCAIRTIQELNQSGATLFLPTTHNGRIKKNRDSWITLLKNEAKAYPSYRKHDLWWNILEAKYKQREMPCSP